MDNLPPFIISLMESDSDFNNGLISDGGSDTFSEIMEIQLKI